MSTKRKEPDFMKWKRIARQKLARDTQGMTSDEISRYLMERDRQARAECRRLAALNPAKNKTIREILRETDAVELAGSGKS